MPLHGFKRYIDAIVDHLKGFVLALIALVSVLGIIVGYKYYRHTQDDPEFCMSCHMMKEAFNAWSRSGHRDIVCQKCHHLSLLEQNRLLVSFVAKGQTPFPETHGVKRPWSECRKCHIDEVYQGSVTLRKSFGHAKHVFMQNIDCRVCHGASLHSFRPDEYACQNCHKDKGVHGIGMEAFSCLKCHSFSDKSPGMVSKDKCLNCHKVPDKGPMSGFQCHQCHKPHSKIKLKSEDCLGQCHSNEASVGQHDLHMKKKMQCLDCHKAHTWTVGRKEGGLLCVKCHQYKDPGKFVY